MSQSGSLPFEARDLAMAMTKPTWIGYCVAIGNSIYSMAKNTIFTKTRWKDFRKWSFSITPEASILDCKTSKTPETKITHSLNSLAYILLLHLRVLQNGATSEPCIRPTHGSSDPSFQELSPQRIQ